MNVNLNAGWQNAVQELIAILNSKATDDGLSLSVSELQKEVKSLDTKVKALEKELKALK